MTPKTDITWTENDDLAVLSGPGLQVLFAREGDRWTHLVKLEVGETIEIARVVESDPNRDDPSRVVSPLYQEVHRHESARGAGPCLLLTGLSSRHHFSAAVSLWSDDEPTPAMVLDFDVADRCRAPVESLAATYLVRLDSGALVDANPQMIAWHPTGPDGGRLELTAVTGTTLALAEAGRHATRVQALAAIEPGAYTHRLRYRWRWTRSSDRTR